MLIVIVTAMDGWSKNEKTSQEGLNIPIKVCECLFSLCFETWRIFLGVAPNPSLPNSFGGLVFLLVGLWGQNYLTKKVVFGMPRERFWVESRDVNSECLQLEVYDTVDGKNPAPVDG